MLRALLYHINRNELRPLAREELLQSAPTPEERARKSDGRHEDGSTLRAGYMQCHESEFVWVDVVAPDADDFQVLAQRFGLHEMVLDDLREKRARPKIHDYGDYSYLAFYAISWAEHQKNENRADFELAEIDCILGPDYLVTVHAAPLSPLEDLHDRWQKHPQMMKSGPARLLYEVMDETLDDYFPALEALDKRIDSIENRLFEFGSNGTRHGSRPLTGEIFALKRDLLQIRHVAGPTRDVVNILLRRDAETGGAHFAYFQDLYDHASRIVDMTDTFRDVLSGALDAFLAVESNRMNSVMKTLTSASIILLVPNLIAAIYGMNFEYMPELHTRYGYFFALGFMLLIVLGLYANFKRKNWL
jgi:magnesium transporter